MDPERQWGHGKSWTKGDSGGVSESESLKGPEKPLGDT